MAFVADGKLYFEYTDGQGFKGKSDITPLLSIGEDLALKFATAIDARCAKYNYKGPVGELRSLMKALGVFYRDQYLASPMDQSTEANLIVKQVFSRDADTLAMDWSDPQRLGRLFHEFRAYFFKTTSNGKNLLSRNDYWAILVNFVTEDLIPKKILIPFLMPRPNSALSSRRNLDEGLKTVVEASGPFGNNEWRKTVTPISLARSDEEYLDEYYRREKQALNLIVDCCRSDIRTMLAEISHGEELLARTNYSELCAKVEASLGGSHPYCEPMQVTVVRKSDGAQYQLTKDVHLFSEKHPEGLPNILCWIKNRYGFFRGATRYSDLPKDLCRVHRALSPGKGLAGGVKDIIKNLGLMTIERAMPLYLFIIARTGNITPEALANADAYGESGILTILSSVGDTDTAKRLTVKKGRAHQEKKAVLDEELSKVIQLVLNMTEPFRKHLKDSNHPHWNKLWLYQPQEKGTPQLIRPYAFQRNLAGSILQNIENTFVYRHPELLKYLPFQAKNIRVSVGVVTYFESGGDIDAAARKLGNTVKISLDRYIPKSVQHAMYRRQIRRHQNLLIVAASAEENYMLQVTDFSSADELHLFLKNMLQDKRRVKGNSLLRILDGKLHGEASKGADEAVSRLDPAKLIVNASSASWAVLFLYKEHIENSNLEFDNADPWAWHELACCLHASFKHPTYRHLRPIYEEALELMENYRGSITFPSV